MAHAAEPVPRLRWTPCHAEADPRLECATFRVPLDHDRRSGPTIELAVIRLPASDPARRIGSLFLNPGGPGTSGVGMVLDAATDGADSVHRRSDRPLRPRRVRSTWDPRQHTVALLRDVAGRAGHAAAGPVPGHRRGRGGLRAGRPDAEPGLPVAWRPHRRPHGHRRRRPRPRPATRRRRRPTTHLRRLLVRLRCSASPTPTCSPGGCGRSSSTASSIRSRGPPAAAMRPAPNRSTTGSATQPEHKPRSTSSSDCATRPEPPAAPSPATPRSASPPSPSDCDDDPITFPDDVTGQPTAFTYAHLVKTAWDAMNVMTTWPDFAQFLADLEAATSDTASDTMREAVDGHRPRPAAGRRLPKHRRRQPGGRVLRQRQPRPPSPLVAGRRRRRPAVRLLRTHVDMVLQHVRHMGRPRRRPVRRPVQPPHRQPDTPRRAPDSTPPRPTTTRSPSTTCSPTRSCSPSKDGATHRPTSHPHCTVQTVSDYLLNGTTPRPGTVCAADAAPFDAAPSLSHAPAAPDPSR